METQISETETEPRTGMKMLATIMVVIPETPISETKMEDKMEM